MKYRTSLAAAVLLALSTALPQESRAFTPAPSASPAVQSTTIFGLTITPNAHQTPEQQTSDGQACYQQAKTDSGVDPQHIVKGTPPPSGSTSSSNTQMAGQAASALGGSMGDMAGGLAGLLGQAQTQYQQAPPQTQQGKPMKAFKKAFRQCLQLKGYTVTKKGKG